MNPRRYGQEPDDDTLYGIVDEHDELDIAVCLAAIELDLPMLALCRGMQVLFVFLVKLVYAQFDHAVPKGFQFLFLIHADLAYES